MKALVTGSTGFVGSHLVEELLREGFDVTCLLRPVSKPGCMENLPVSFRRASLHSHNELVEAVRDMQYVFHVAGLTRARTADDYRKANTETTRQLLEAVVDSGTRLRRFVYVSSLAAAGPARGEEPIDESTTPHPLAHYGASKLAAEQVVLSLADRVPVTIVRPPVVYGPRDRNVLVLFRTAQRFHILPVIGSAQNVVGMVHVADLVRGIRLAAVTAAGAGRVYFLSGGNHRLDEVAADIGKALRLRVRPIRIPPPVARLIGEWGELVGRVSGRPQLISRRKIKHAIQPRWTCSSARAERELGFTANVQLAEGLTQTAQWYAEQGWIRHLPRG